MKHVQRDTSEARRLEWEFMTQHSHVDVGLECVRSGCAYDRACRGRLDCQMRVLFRECHQSAFDIVQRYGFVVVQNRDMFMEPIFAITCNVRRNAEVISALPAFFLVTWRGLICQVQSQMSMMQALRTALKGQPCQENCFEGILGSQLP